MIANFSHLSKKWENKINFLILKMILIAKDQKIIDSISSDKTEKDGSSKEISIDDIDFKFNSISDVEQTIKNEEGVVDTSPEDKAKENES
jgi:hypothetical protein